MRIIAATILLTASELSFLTHAFMANPSRSLLGGAATGSVQRIRLATSSSRLNSGSSDNYDDSCDVLVLGSGPAGCAIASVLGASGDLDVVVANKDFDNDWVPNYGVWEDEWQTILDRYNSVGVDINDGEADKVIDRKWGVTDCFFGGSYDIPTEQRMRLDRPYCRLDRFALKDSLTKNFRVVKANHFPKQLASTCLAQPVVWSTTRTEAPFNCNPKIPMHPR